jgi:oxygen-dependent protoporphyrinogen oxidase
VGHAERVREIMALLRMQPGLYLTGSAYDGVGIPDCVRHAQETARAVLADLPAHARAESHGT